MMRCVCAGAGMDRSRCARVSVCLCRGEVSYREAWSLAASGVGSIASCARANVPCAESCTIADLLAYAWREGKNARLITRGVNSSVRDIPACLPL